VSFTGAVHLGPMDTPWGTSQQSIPPAQHWSPQQVSLAGHGWPAHGGSPQVPALQKGLFPWHFFPHVPQLWMSFISLTHAPSQQVSPAPHPGEHVFPPLLDEVLVVLELEVVLAVPELEVVLAVPVELVLVPELVVVPELLVVVGLPLAVEPPVLPEVVLFAPPAPPVLKSTVALPPQPTRPTSATTVMPASKGLFMRARRCKRRARALTARTNPTGTGSAPCTRRPQRCPSRSGRCGSG
jgi:hypothetical protein